MTVQNRYNLEDQRSESGGALDRIAGQHDATPAQIALAWLLARSAVMLPIPGTSSVEHLEENPHAASIRLSPEQVAEIGSASRG